MPRTGGNRLDVDDDRGRDALGWRCGFRWLRSDCPGGFDGAAPAAADTARGGFFCGSRERSALDNRDDGALVVAVSRNGSAGADSLPKSTLLKLQSTHAGIRQRCFGLHSRCAHCLESGSECPWRSSAPEARDCGSDSLRTPPLMPSSPASTALAPAPEGALSLPTSSLETSVGAARGCETPAPAPASAEDGNVATSVASSFSRRSASGSSSASRDIARARDTDTRAAAPMRSAFGSCGWPEAAD